MERSGTITIEQATDRLIDYRGKTPPKTKSGVRLITAKVVKGGQILEEPKEFIAEDFYDQWMRRGLPQKYDVLLTTEAPLGEVAVLRDDDRIALAQRIILLRAKNGCVDPLYLYYALQSEFGQGELKARASGTTVLGIKQSELRQVRIPITSLSEQQRIARMLWAYDELIENNRQRIRILEEMARALYREWFVAYRFPGHDHGRMTKRSGVAVPVGWDLVPMPACVEINPRVSVPKGTEVHFVPMAALANDCMLITEFETRAASGGSKFQNGDTLFARITPCLENGKTGFVQFLHSSEAVAMGSTEFIVLRSRSLTPEFVYCLARSEEVRNAAIASMSGASGRQRVQEKCFDTIQIASPPRQLLDRFSAIVAPSFRLIQSLFEQSQRLRKARDLLLPRLLAGGPVAA